MKAEAKNKPIKVLAPVRQPDGTITHYAWVEVPGTVISLEGVTLKNGETLSVSYEVTTLSRSE